MLLTASHQLDWSLTINETSLSWWNSCNLFLIHVHARCTFCMHLITNCYSCAITCGEVRALSALTFKWEGAAKSRSKLRTETTLMALLFERTKMHRARRKLQILRTRHHIIIEPQRKKRWPWQRKEARALNHPVGTDCVCLQAVRVWRAATKIAAARSQRARTPSVPTLVAVALESFLFVR